MKIPIKPIEKSTVPVLASSRACPLPQGSPQVLNVVIPVGAGKPAKSSAQEYRTPQTTKATRRWPLCAWGV
ncbi:hypothetical protein EGJ15_04510 [Pseudomonas sp. p99-361]|nr:hypothetical protein EGJ15_04510 [Pseudomonas sp. p99-361]